MENFSAINVSRKHKQFTSESAHANNQSVNMRLCLGIIEFKLFKYVPFQAKNSVKGISAYITNFKFTFLKPYVEAMVCVCLLIVTYLSSRDKETGYKGVQK